MSGNQLQSAVESLNQPSLNRFQTSLEPLNQLQSSAEHGNQIQTSDEMSLMYLLQQQQQASNVNTSSSTSSSALMMMSPTTLQSLLMAAIQQHPSASQYIVGTVPTISVQMTMQSDVIQQSSYQTTTSSSQCLTTASIQNLQTTVPTSLVPKSENVAPKKPLTPYMKFSKSIWQHVKNANPSLSVCEVGANIGRMWREMPEADKHRYNDDFSREKAQYEVELQEYIRSSGVQPMDNHKIKSVIPKKNNPKDKYPPRSTPSDVSSNNVLPHIGQIWSSNHNHQVPPEQLIDVSNVQVAESLLPRSINNDGLPQNDINIDLADSLLTSSQSAWLEQSDDAKRLLGGETEFSDGLEPGEVVFDDVPAVAKTAHNLFNSYAFNPWKRFQGLSVNTSFERDHLLESERRHLRLALEDKMGEVRELTANIQKAYETIDELRRILVERQQDEETGRANGCSAVAEVDDRCLVEQSTNNDETVGSDANILQVLNESNDTRWTNDSHYQPTTDSLITGGDNDRVH